MKRTTALATLAEVSNENLPAGLANDSPFIDELEALRRVPVSRRTGFEWRKKGLPYIRVGKRILYDWGSVRNWLLRQQQGAA
jgi:hypothetical protein